MGQFKPITNAMELKALCEEDENNVGVTRSGELYSFDNEKDKPQKITIEEASEKLGLSLDIMAEVAKSGGHFEVPSPIVVEEKEEVESDHKEEIGEDHENDAPPGEEKDAPPGEEKESLEVEIKFSTEELEKILEPLIEEIKELRNELKSDREVAKTRYDEFKELESKILL